MTKEAYTLVLRGNLGTTEFWHFFDREALKSVISSQVIKEEHCYVVSGHIEIVDFQVFWDEMDPTKIALEDESEYIEEKTNQ